MRAATRGSGVVLCAMLFACGRTAIYTFSDEPDLDAGFGDAGVRDAGAVDGGARDSGVIDAGTCFDLDAQTEATLDVTADNQRTVWVNGVLVESTTLEWYQPSRLLVTLWRHPARQNVIAVRGVNLTNQAGLDRGVLLSLRLGSAVLVSDRSWRQVGASPSDLAWVQPGFDDSAWGDSVEQATFGAPPWGRVGVIDPSAKWIWSYLSSTASKPAYEPVAFRRTVSVSLDGGFSSTPLVCP